MHSEFDTIPCAKEPREIYVSPGSHYRLGCVSCLRGDESIVQVLMTQDTENGVLITIKGGQIQTEKK